MDPRIQEVIDAINGKPQADLSIAEMAESVSLSPSRFLHLFKVHTGESPASYRKRLRMARARELLETTWMKVKHIREGVGLNDASHFVREFKRVHGLTPTEYRVAYRRGRRDKSKTG